MSSQGMRTILKRRVDPLKRMRQKFEAGLYDDGYPKSLEILSLNPPLADPPGVSSDVKNRSKLARRVARGERRRRRRGEAASHEDDEDDPNHMAGNIVLPTDRLVRSYLRRNPASVPSYEDKVGIGDVDGHYGYRKGHVTDAFHFAERQREYLLKNHDMRDEVTGELLTRREREERSVRAIEEVLRREDREERFKSRSTAREARREAKDGSSPGDAPAAAEVPSSTYETVNDGSGDDEDGTGSKPGTPSILHGSAATALEMSAWGDKLAHVPYGRWTIGAAASLDHWIATSILGLSERSWQKILEGRTETVSRARDVAAVRTALFPETMEGSAAAGGEGIGSVLEEEDDDDVEIAAESETDRSIDELLASLGAGQDDEDDDDIWGEKLGDDDDDEGEEEEGEIDRWDETDDERLARLKRELREWQARNHEVRYDDWSEKERKKFNDWLVGYVSTLTAEDDEGAVDMDGTRREIFAEPYFSNERDASMWSALADETDAEMVLRDLLERGHEYLRGATADGDDDVVGAEAEAMAEEREGLAAFLELPYDEQLHKLRSIGALRPMRDESVPETEVDDFVRDHEAVLRDGVVVDRLVPDLRGAITAKDLFGLPVDENRFSYQKTELGGEAERQGASSRDDAARDAALYRAWGRYRANVANHEEELFGDDKLGLEYEEEEKEGTVTGTRP